MILSAHTPHQHGGIERRSRHHGQYLARFGLNHHNAPQLVLHQLFAVGLQIHIYCQGKIFTRLRYHIVFALFVTAFYPAVGIAEQNLHPFLATQYLFVKLLNPRAARIVALHIVGIFLNIPLVHLSYVTQHMGGIRILILADGTVLDIKTRKLIQLLLQHTVLLCRKLIHKHLRHIRRVTRIKFPVFDVAHPFDKLSLGYTQYITQVGCIKRLNLAHNQHHVVGRLVIHQ